MMVATLDINSFLETLKSYFGSCRLRFFRFWRMPGPYEQTRWRLFNEVSSLTTAVI